jgi:hypothetical protein
MAVLAIWITECYPHYLAVVFGCGCPDEMLERRTTNAEAMTVKTPFVYRSTCISIPSGMVGAGSKAFRREPSEQRRMRVQSG